MEGWEELGAEGMQALSLVDQEVWEEQVGMEDQEGLMEEQAGMEDQEGLEVWEEQAGMEDQEGLQVWEG